MKIKNKKTSGQADQQGNDGCDGRSSTVRDRAKTRRLPAFSKKLARTSRGRKSQRAKRKKIAVPAQVGRPVLTSDRSVPAPLHIIARSPSSTSRRTSHSFSPLLPRPSLRPSLLQQSLVSSFELFLHFCRCRCCVNCSVRWPIRGPCFLLCGTHTLAFTPRSRTHHPLLPICAFVDRDRKERAGSSAFVLLRIAITAIIQASNRVSFDPCVTTRHLSNRRSLEPLRCVIRKILAIRR